MNQTTSDGILYDNLGDVIMSIALASSIQTNDMNRFADHGVVADFQTSRFFALPDF